MLTLTPAGYGEMVDHCLRELPNEACGFLAGRGGRVEQVLPVRSAAPRPDRYAMDPQDQFRAIDGIDRAGLEVSGIYHSHPDGPAAPSGIDLEQVFWPGTEQPGYPGAVQVIVSLRDRGAPVVKGYVATAGRLLEAPIAVG